MSHPTDHLTEYALGDLPSAKAAEVERHLASCPPCRAELRELREGVVALVESLPAAPTDGWEPLASRLERPAPAPPARLSPARAAPWAAALVFLLLGLAGLWWGVERGSAYRQAVAEQRRVASWLARPEVQRLPLTGEGGRAVGSVLLASDARALVVLREQAPPGRAYAAWGHEDDEATLLWLGRDSVFEVTVAGFDELYLSLEPVEGSAAPTEDLAELEL